MLSYHDDEWGVPVHDDRKLHEFLHLGEQRELLPRRYVQRRHRVGRRVDRTATADPTTDGIRRCRGEHAQDQTGQGRPHVAWRREQSIADQDPPRIVDDARGQLGATDVDGKVAAGHANRP